MYLSCRLYVGELVSEGSKRILFFVIVKLEHKVAAEGVRVCDVELLEVLVVAERLLQRVVELVVVVDAEVVDEGGEASFS